MCTGYHGNYCSVYATILTITFNYHCMWVTMVTIKLYDRYHGNQSMYLGSCSNDFQSADDFRYFIRFTRISFYYNTLAMVVKYTQTEKKTTPHLLRERKDTSSNPNIQPLNIVQYSIHCILIYTVLFGYVNGSHTHTA